MIKLFWNILAVSVVCYLASCSNSNGNNNCGDSCSTDTTDGLRTDKNPDAITSLTNKIVYMENGNWKVILSWTGSPDVNYVIKRGTVSGVYTDTYDNVTNPYTISNLLSGTTQYFVVLSTMTANNTKVIVTSREFAVNIPIDNYSQKPGEFAMSAVSGDGQVTLSWEAADRATFYVIQSGPSSGSYPNVVAKAAKSPYVDKVPNGSSRYYIVIAVNSAGSTNAKAEAVGTPMPGPGTFGTVTANVGNGQITLVWGTATNATHYIIRRGTQHGVYDSTPISNSATSPFTDTGLTNGTTYYYLVTAVNDSGSVDAAEVSVVPQPPPGNFTISGFTATLSGITLTWATSTNATTYTVQYGTSSGSYPNTVSNDATSPFTVTGLNPGTQYYFIIIAVNASGSIPATGELIASTAQQFSASNSTVSALNTNSIADNTSTVIIRVIVRDSNNVVVSGQSVTLTTDKGTVTNSPQTSDSNGLVEFIVKSDIGGLATYTATTDGPTTLGTTTVTYSGWLYPDAVLADNPVAYWRFNETTGTTAKDYSHGNYPATNSGNYPATYVGSPILGQDATAIGSYSRGANHTTVLLNDQRIGTQYISLPSLLFSSEFAGANPKATIEGWLAPQITPIGGPRFFDFADNSNRSFYFNIRCCAFNNILFATNDGANEQDILLPDNSASFFATAFGVNWIYIAVTMDGTDGNVIVRCPACNDAYNTSGTIANSNLLSTLNNFFLGKSQNNDGYFNGWVSDVAIYNYILTSTQMSDHISAANR